MLRVHNTYQFRAVSIKSINKRGRQLLKFGGVSFVWIWDVIRYTCREGGGRSRKTMTNRHR